MSTFTHKRFEMMPLFTRILGSDARVSRVRPGKRSRRRAAIGLEPLEGRELLSGNIAGVTFQNGALNITGTKADHNAAQVAIDPANGLVKVTLNGQSVEYSKGDIWSMSYTGAQG